MDMKLLAQNAKRASIELSGVSTKQKNEALMQIADALFSNKEKIFIANEKDIERSRTENLSMPLIKRLRLDENKLTDIIDGIKSLINLEDPVGKTLLSTELDEGLELFRVSCPIGLIGIIFESRPDALVQISTLCLKSGNAVMLKGGREALLTNRCLYETIAAASEKAGLPANWINLLKTGMRFPKCLSLTSMWTLLSQEAPMSSSDI